MCSFFEKSVKIDRTLSSKADQEKSRKHTSISTMKEIKNERAYRHKYNNSTLQKFKKYIFSRKLTEQLEEVKPWKNTTDSPVPIN